MINDVWEIWCAKAALLTQWGVQHMWGQHSQDVPEGTPIERVDKKNATATARGQEQGQEKQHRIFWMSASAAAAAAP